MLHLLHPGRDDDAVVVAAVARQNAEEPVGRGVDDREGIGIGIGIWFWVRG